MGAWAAFSGCAAGLASGAAFAGFWGWGAFSAFAAFPAGEGFSAFVAEAVFCPAFSFFAVGSFFVGAALSFASLGGRPFRFGGSVPFSPFCFGAASFVPLAASFAGVAGAVLPGAFPSYAGVGFCASFFPAMISEKL